MDSRYARSPRDIAKATASSGLSGQATAMGEKRVRMGNGNKLHAPVCFVHIVKGQPEL
jgi:hypothetical protein